ncbi:MAG: glycerol-3-phosphate 1-O-acyltransferase PlsY [Candidatus Omnitrophica bacterium]|nr:glycerol-3-phosphate 1-O-acyltransferase PlsY [Candidatus Omnitrophota bacterium]
MLNLFFLFASYIIGSIPFGFIISLLVKNIDIRNFGSGNIGATNVFRSVGKGWGTLVFILDLLKGIIPVFLMKVYLPGSTEYLFILAAILVVCGHNWTVFLRFKGGKGVATSLGALIGLSFVFQNLGLILVLSITSWIAVFVIYRYVSLASLFAGSLFFILTLFLAKDMEIKLLSFLFSVFIWIKHKKNIKRLLEKKENRF